MLYTIISPSPVTLSLFNRIITDEYAQMFQCAYSTINPCNKNALEILSLLVSHFNLCPCGRFLQNAWLLNKDPDYESLVCIQAPDSTVEYEFA